MRPLEEQWTEGRKAVGLHGSRVQGGDKRKAGEDEMEELVAAGSTAAAQPTCGRSCCHRWEGLTVERRGEEEQPMEEKVEVEGRSTEEEMMKGPWIGAQDRRAVTAGSEVASHEREETRVEPLETEGEMERGQGRRGQGEETEGEERRQREVGAEAAPLHILLLLLYG